MTESYEELSHLDKRIHEPARLAIMTALSACTSADFTYLQRLTGMTQGNLSGHLAKLEEAGLVKLEKRFVNKRPCTAVRITPEGATAIDRHWEQLERLKRNAKELTKKE